MIMWDISFLFRQLRTFAYDGYFNDLSIGAFDAGFGSCSKIEESALGCIEYYGYKRGKVICRDYYDDFYECTHKHKQVRLFHKTVWLFWYIKASELAQTHAGCLCKVFNFNWLERVTVLKRFVLEKILKQISKHKSHVFLRSSKIAGFSPLLRSREEKGAIFKKRGFEIRTYIFFPLTITYLRFEDKVFTK